MYSSDACCGPLLLARLSLKSNSTDFSLIISAAPSCGLVEVIKTLHFALVVSSLGCFLWVFFCFEEDEFLEQWQVSNGRYVFLSVRVLLITRQCEEGGVT